MKRPLIAILAVFVLFAAGCAPQEPQAPDLSEAYIGGVGGLAASFPEGMPPQEVFDAGQQQFSVGVMLENVGESSVGLDSLNPYGYVELIGINPSQFGKLPQNMRIYFHDAALSLQGARRGFDGSVVPGDTSLIEFSSLAYQPDRVGNEEVTIRANVCYEYRSYADAEICFKDNVLENALDDTICTLTGAKPLSTSAAPVQVTQVTQNPAGSDRIQITFVIDNVGNGMVFAPSQFQSDFGNSFGADACSFNVGANPNRDVVWVEVTLGSEDIHEISCPLLGGGNSGVVRMYQGAPATVTCTLGTLGREGSRIFTDSLHIDAWYTYMEFIETPVLIRDQNIGFVERGDVQR